MYYFTADEHFGHENIIEYCKRPFSSVEEMDEVMIQNHNSIVTKQDITVHIGDFSLASKKYQDIQNKYIIRLNGHHIFIPGSHDYWLKGKNKQSHIWQKSINKQQVICCHYPMYAWPASHWNSWHLFGHVHGQFEGVGKSLDVGVDVFNFKPVSFDEIVKIMESRPDNLDRIKPT